MVNSREKGKRYERHVASLFRSEGYGARRGQQFNGLDGEDVVGVPGIHIECKHQERMQLYDWMSQAKADAREGDIPIVIHRKNNHADLVTMEFADWCRLYREWECSHSLSVRMCKNCKHHGMAACPMWEGSITEDYMYCSQWEIKECK